MYFYKFYFEFFYVDVFKRLRYRYQVAYEESVKLKEMLMYVFLNMVISQRICEVKMLKFKYEYVKLKYIVISFF